MDRTIALCALPLLASLLGCNPTVTFDTTVMGSTTIPKSTVGGLISFPGTLPGLNDIRIDQRANLAGNNTDKSHIDHVRVKSMTLTVTTPTPGDLPFLTSLSFSVSAAGQADKRISHLEAFPKGSATVQMQLDGVDLAPYAKADSFSILASGQGTAPTQDTTIEVSTVLTIEAHVL